ncbi:hypothetical protein HIM_09835 [Hirsutella minnesotensis 3608]|uniref:Uncharacterized protein n=1 Tax=Hirsutella minnesotensis 3608 TaxID=1043627 RepID=A0A0F7ZKV2_9HYPO|nr:hypothetical protein HIM_09835 [Hirsutella minnesotensis 3608]
MGPRVVAAGVASNVSRREADLIFRDGYRAAARKSRVSKRKLEPKPVRKDEPQLDQAPATRRVFGSDERNDENAYVGELEPKPVRRDESQLEQAPATRRVFESDERYDENAYLDELAVIPQTLQLPIEDQASCHLLANFVLVPHGHGGQGFLHYIVPLKLKRPTPLHFQHAFDACALVSLNNQVGRDDGLRRKALDKYVKALAELSVAIRDPEASKQEATLASTLLCGMFETFTGSDDQMRGLNYHTEGAIQLVKSIGRERLLSTDIGKAIFTGISSSLRAAKRPPMSNEWWITGTTTDEHHLAYLKLVMATIDVRADTERLLASIASSSELAAMIEKCHAVRLMCLEWQRTAPEYWQFHSVCLEDDVPNTNYEELEAYPGRVDRYSDIGTATVWNSVRVARLIVNSLALRCAARLCSPRDYRTTPTYLSVARDSSEIVTDIIAGVPFHLGWAGKQGLVSQKPDSSAFACGEETAQKGLGGLRMIFILSYLHALDFTSDSQRLWVRGRLAYAGTRLGIRYAYNMSKFRTRVPSMSIAKDKMVCNQSPDSEGGEALRQANSYFQMMSSGKDSAVPDVVAQGCAYTTSPRPLVESATALT